MKKAPFVPVPIEPCRLHGEILVPLAKALESAQGLLHSRGPLAREHFLNAASQHLLQALDLLDLKPQSMKPNRRPRPPNPVLRDFMRQQVKYSRLSIK